MLIRVCGYELQSAPAAELAKAQFRRGLACKGLGEWAAAVESLEEANKLQPRDETKTELARARSRLLTDTAERSLPADELRNPAMQGDPIIKSATTSSTTTKIKPNSPVQVVSDKPATASDEKEKEKAKPSPRAETKEKKEQPQQTQSPHKQPLPPPVSASVIFTAPKSLPEFERVYAEIRHDSDAVTRFFKVCFRLCFVLVCLPFLCAFALCCWLLIDCVSGDRRQEVSVAV